MSDPRRLLDEDSEASPLLRELLASARRADEPSPSRIAAVSAGLAPLLGPSVPPPPVAAPIATGAGHAAIAAKLGAAIVTLGALGALGVIGRAVWDAQPHRASSPPAAIAPDARSAPAVLAPDADGVEPAVAPDPVVDLSPGPAPGPASAPPARPSRSPAAARDRADEGKLVLSAEAALVGGDAAAALALTRQHGARFPDGAHAEERDRIAIEALVRLGRADRARAAADRFFTRYPRSIYRARLESLLR